jgi:hypothetical protein
MAVLFDPADEYVCSVLDRAKVHGEISLAELESILEAGIEDKDNISTEDIGDTIDALADMGIEIDNGLTQQQEDDEFLRSMREWPGSMPQLTGEGWDQLVRAVEREKAAESAPPDVRKATEEEAATREILSQRTFIQDAFAHLGPQVRRTRPRIR